MIDDRRFAKLINICALCGCLLWSVFALLNHFFPNEYLLTLAITAGTTAYHFVMRLGVGWIIPSLFRRHLNPDSFWFRQKAVEPRLYRFLRLRRWKGKMPTYNPSEFCLDSNSPEQIIRNSCTAELVHEVIVPLSFLPLLAANLWGAFPVFLITSILAAGVDCCFIWMQRYNRPRFQKYQRRIANSTMDRRQRL